MTKKEYEEKIDILNGLSMAYYRGIILATDDEYDKLARKCLEYELANPDNVSPVSPNTRISDTINKGFTKARHITRMWSQQDIFNEEEFDAWFKSIQSHTLNVTFIVEPKYDGLSLNVIYKKGKFHKAITRGNGSEGEDVTLNARTIKTIPLDIEFRDIPDTVELKGEVVISKSNFLLLNEAREANNEPLFANSRNAAAGSLKQLDPKITATRYLEFRPWSMDDISNGLQSYGLELIKGFGLKTDFIVCKTKEDILKAYKSFLDRRDEIDVELDGVVIKVNELGIRPIFGYTAKYPKWSCAYKFPAMEKTTTVKDIKIQVGRTGVITPVAIVEPVELSGAIVEKCTLHNYSEIANKDIKIGDQVIIIRSGDVIPKITYVFTERRNGTEKTIYKPLHCPVCSTKLQEENIVLRCINEQCKGRIITNVSNFVSKGCMNITGLGESTVEKLIDNKFIKDPADIFLLTYEKLGEIENFKYKKVTNILDAIEKAKHPTMDRFIVSLGIPGVGEVIAKIIAKKLKQPEDIITIDRSTLLDDVDGIGDVVSMNIIHYYAKNLEYLLKLFKLTEPVLLINKVVSDKHIGKTFVVTGTFSKHRDEIKRLIESLGGKVGTSVSSKTDYLVMGSNPGNDKLDKAKELNIKIIKEGDI